MLVDPQAFIAPAVCLFLGIACVVFVLVRRYLRRAGIANLAKNMGFAARDVHTPNVTKEEEYLLRRGLGTGLTYSNFIDGKRDGFLVEIYDQTQSQILSGATIISHTVI